VWKWLEADQKTTTGVTHGIHIHGMNPLPGIVEFSIALFNCERRYGSGFLEASKNHACLSAIKTEVCGLPYDMSVHRLQKVGAGSCH